MRAYLSLNMLLLMVCSSCTVGPKYKRPYTKIPETYKNNIQAGSLEDLNTWWHLFQDKYLERLIQQAIRNNYDLQIACEKINEARAVYGIKAANLAPEIDVIGRVNRSHVSQKLTTNTGNPTGDFSYFKLGFDASWELDFWGGLRKARSAGCHQYQAQIEHMRDVYLILLGDIARTYVDIRSFQKKIQLFKQQITYDQELLTLVHDRFLAGIDSEESYLEQKATLATSQTFLNLQEESLEQAIISLAILLGEPNETFTLETSTYNIPMIHKNLSVGLPSEVLRRRPDIRQAERIVMAATDLVGEAVARWFPRFSLLGSLTPESNKLSTLFSHNSISWSIGPSLYWPIITFGRIKYKIKEQDSIRKQAALTYAKTVLNAFGDVETGLVTYLQTQKNLELLHTKVKVLTLNQIQKQSLFESGLSDQQEVIIAAKKLLSVELEIAESQQRLSTAIIATYKALGGGW